MTAPIPNRVVAFPTRSLLHPQGFGDGDFLRNEFRDHHNEDWNLVEPMIDRVGRRRFLAAAVRKFILPVLRESGYELEVEEFTGSNPLRITHLNGADQRDKWVDWALSEGIIEPRFIHVPVRDLVDLLRALNRHDAAWNGEELWHQADA